MKEEDIDIGKYWKPEWFKHIDCQSRNCIFSFIEDNFDKFKCDHAKSCYHGKLIRKIKELEWGVDYQGKILIGLRDELNRNSSAILSLIAILNKHNGE